MTADASMAATGSGAGLGAAPMFGMMVNHLDRAFPSVPFGIERFWDTGGTAWPFLEPQNGQFTFDKLDTQLADDLSHGVKVAFYTLSRPPAWASSKPTDDACNYGPGECDPPSDLAPDGSGSNQHWRGWVKAIGQHVNDPAYRQNHAHVRYWEIWNEIDRSGTIGTSRATSNLSYSGTFAQLVRMTEDARCILLGEGVIHNYPHAGAVTACAPSYSGLDAPIDATAKIVMPSSHTEGAMELAIAQNFLYCNANPVPGSNCTTGSAGAAAVDVINFHMKPGNEPTARPETQITADVTSGQGVLQAAELAKPFWNGEAGYSAKGWTGAYADQDMRASFVPRYFLLQWSLGVASVHWYTWDLDNVLTGDSALAATAWRTTYSWMVGAKLTTSCAASGDIWTCGLTLAGGASAQVIWDASKSCVGGACATSTRTVDDRWTSYQDVTGATHPISGHRVAVGIKPVLLQ